MGPLTTLQSTQGSRISNIFKRREKKGTQQVVKEIRSHSMLQELSSL